jgi:hypothetical protein
MADNRGSTDERLDAILSAIQQRREQGSLPRGESSSFVRDVVGRGAIGQGLMMGYGDEARAWAQSHLYGGTYEERLAEEREALARARSERPWTMTGAEIAGGLAPIAFTFGGAAPVVGAANAGRVGSLLAQTGQAALRGAAGGAVGGAVQGFGEGEGGFAARADKALEGGAVGSLCGHRRRIVRAIRSIAPWMRTTSRQSASSLITSTAMPSQVRPACRRQWRMSSRGPTRRRCWKDRSISLDAIAARSSVPSSAALMVKVTGSFRTSNRCLVSEAATSTGHSARWMMLAAKMHPRSIGGLMTTT